MQMDCRPKQWLLRLESGKCGNETAISHRCDRQRGAPKRRPAAQKHRAGASHASELLGRVIVAFACLDHAYYQLFCSSVRTG